MTFGPLYCDLLYFTFYKFYSTYGILSSPRKRTGGVTPRQTVYIKAIKKAESFYALRF